MTSDSVTRRGGLCFPVGLNSAPPGLPLIPTLPRDNPRIIFMRLWLRLPAGKERLPGIPPAELHETPQAHTHEAQHNTKQCITGP